MEIRVIAIDPGITTGIAKGRIVDNHLQFTATKDNWNQEHQHWNLWKELCEYSPEIVVYERFEYRRHLEKAELFSRELIGIIKLFGDTFSGVQLVAQMPSQAMGHFSNDKLKAMGCYTVGSEHPRDATRHLLYWWTFGAGFKYRGTEGTEKML